MSVTGIVLLVLGFALDIVEPADGYTDSWAPLVWGAGILVERTATARLGIVLELAIVLAQESGACSSACG